MLHHWTQHDCNAARKAISPTCRSALQRSHPGKSEPNICSIWSSCFDFQWISKIIFAPFHSQQMRCRFLHGPCIFWSSNLLFHFRTISYGIGNTTQTSNTHTHTLGESSWDRWVSWLSTKTMVLRPERRPDCPKDSKLDIWPISAIMGSNCK